MKKKIIVIVISLVVILQFTGCKKESATDNSNTLTLLINKSDSDLLRKINTQ